MLNNRRILLGVTGGIAAYKSAELCRLFIRSGAEVQVVMSRAACEFITPLTLETLSGRPVPVEMFERRVGKVQHIDLAGGAEVMVIAPATADYLARSAQGRASDLISAVTLAFGGPILAAPAMNTGMWNNPATRRNIETLSSAHGWRFVQPGTGELACGWSGAGRMAEPAEILEATAKVLAGDLDGRRVLVTAGPTVEDLDPVRFLSNRSTGKTGYAVAAAAARRGAAVILVSGPTALDAPPGVELVAVRSAREMEAAVDERAEDCDAVVMTAAVADYRPAETAEHKLKKADPGEERSVALVRNPDILAGLGRRFADRPRPVLVGFALETRDLVESAKGKLESKGVQLIVANLAADGFGGDDTRAIILGDDGSCAETGDLSKAELAEQILDRLLARWSK
jgi:phosphopantothenoylcysteine decarboxylase/phosphopantothenate--cysteine ligase